MSLYPRPVALPVALRTPLTCRALFDREVRDDVAAAAMALARYDYAAAEWVVENAGDRLEAVALAGLHHTVTELALRMPRCDIAGLFLAESERS